MNPIDKAFAILRKVCPDFTTDSFIQKITPIFNLELSVAENKTNILKAIKQGMFGSILAKAADYLLEKQPTLEESIKTIQDFDLEGKTTNHQQEDTTKMSKENRDILAE